MNEEGCFLLLLDTFKRVEEVFDILLEQLNYVW